VRIFLISLGRAALMTAILVSGCHRSGSEFTMARLHEEIRDLEIQTTVDFLSDMYPSYEEWLILPGTEAPDSWNDSLSVWFESYRIVSPDTLKSSDWTRFLRQPGRAEFLSVLGYLEKPRDITPCGFRGFLVRFRVMGVESTALLVDRTTMRWLAWLEDTALMHGDWGYTQDMDSVSSHIAHYLASKKYDAELRSVRSELPDLYHDPPPVFIDPEELFRLALRHAQPAIEDVHDGIVNSPSLEMRNRIMNRPALPELSLLEPELLQERLHAMQVMGWPCFHLSFSTIRNLVPGTYIWAEGPYDQLWAVPVETRPGSPGNLRTIGPSALFFGRNLSGAGMMLVAESGAISRIVEINTYPFEYGLSIYSQKSIGIAENAGDVLFSRMGFLLSIIPDSSEGMNLPRLRTLPEENPAVHAWRIRAADHR